MQDYGSLALSRMISSTPPGLESVRGGGTEYVGNFTGCASIGHSGVEVQTMDTYYGVQPLTVKGLLPASIASWKTAVPARSLTVGFGALYAAWGSDNCAQNPDDPLFNISGANQTCSLKLSLEDVVAAGASSVAVFTLNAFGCGTHYKFPMCQLPVDQEWPPNSWWPLLYNFRYSVADATKYSHG